MSRVGRPPTDGLEVFARVANLVTAEPELAAHPGLLRQRVGAREARVRAALKLVRELRAIAGSAPLPSPARGRPVKGSPNSPSGLPEEGRE